MLPLRLNLLGAPQVYLADQPLPALPYAKAQALLFYLVVEAQTSHARPALAEMFWAYQTEEKARQNLRQALLRLRQTLTVDADEPPFLLITRRSVQWNPQRPLVCDVANFRACLARADHQPDPLPALEEALRVYRGDFLHRFVLDDSIEFDTWATQQREELHVAAVTAASRLIATYAQDNQPAEAHAAARRLLELEPWNEEAYQTLMRLALAQGKYGEAIQHYQRCVQWLHAELALEPDTITTQLYEQAHTAQARTIVPVNRPPALHRDGLVARLRAWCAGAAEPTTALDNGELARRALTRARNATDEPGNVCARLVDAMTLLGEDGWQHEYPLMLELCTAAATNAVRVGNDSVVNDLATQIRNHAATLLDTLPLVLLQVEYLTRRQHARSALRLALPVLAMLGVPLPEQATPTMVEQAFAALQPRLAALPAAALPTLPPMTDANAQAAMQLLHALHIPTFVVDPNVNALLILNQMRLSIEQGRTPQMALAVASYGVLYGQIHGDAAAGYPFGQIARQCLTPNTPAQIVTMTNSKILAFLAHWCEPLGTLLDPMQQVAENAIAAGEVMGAMSVLHIRAFCLLQAGTPLAEVARQVNHDLQFYRRYAVDLRASPSTYTLCYVQALQGQTANPRFLLGSAEDDATRLTHLETVGNTLLRYMFCTSRMMLRYLLHDYAGAAADLANAEPHAASVTGLLRQAIALVYHSLITLAQDSTCTPDNLQRVRSQQAQLRQWATHAPSNFAHKWHLVEAELCRVRGDIPQAATHYQQAITLAQQAAFVHDAALAAERAMLFYAARGDQQHATRYAALAHTHYTAWGAHVKVVQVATAP